MTAGLAVAVLLTSVTAGAVALPVDPGSARGGSLTQVGPLADHGFPAWYRDSNGVRLEACTTLDDPLCSTLPDEVPDPDAPISYPDNFPGEFFYQLASATVTGAGVDMTIGMDLEGAWATDAVVPGDQMVFGRIRIRDKAIANGRYRVTHPYGVDEFVANGDGINYTQDIGTTPGAFGQALASRVGPFLRWDPAVAPAAPAGYVGDPGVDHKVVGSPYGTNFVRVERIAADGTPTTLAQTQVFSVQGRYARNAGVDVQQATYASSDDGSFVDVYATSDAGQSLHVEDTGLGFVHTRMRGDRGAYYARLAATGAPDGRSVSVVNAGDTPVARKTVKLVDVVTVTKAAYDADAMTVTVAASSSDRDDTPATLRVLDTPLTGGTAVVPGVVAPPATVTVTSDKGGSATVPVTASGAGMRADTPEAAAFATPPTAAPGQRVALDGAGSAGTITAWSWRQVPATKAEDVPVVAEDGTPGTAPSTVEVPVTDANRVTLTGAASSTPTFTAPAATGPIAFELVVSGPAGTSAPVTVTVDVVAPAADPSTGEPAKPVADAGADQTVRRGTVAALDGSASTLADTYAWTQTGGPAVALTGAATAKPSFTFPAMPLPAQNANGSGNPGYAVDARPVALRLTVEGRGTTVTDEVTVRPQPETLEITSAEFRAGKEWRVSGTSTIVANQRVAVVLGSALTGRVLGYANVDATGVFAFRGAGDVTPAATTTTVSAVSALGDDDTGFTFRRK